MDDLFKVTTRWMDGQLDRLSSLSPSPTEEVASGFSKLYFAEKTPQQAIVLKLARIISGLRAANVLLEVGYLQEQAALCRMVSEFQDDVVFLSLATQESPTPELLHKYLDSFFEEERSIESYRSGERVKGRALVSRKDIVNFISRHQSAVVDPFQSSNAVLAVGHAFSGYVHGAASHILEMYDLNSNSFVTEASRNHPLRADHEHDIWNYYYRGVLAFGYAAAAFNDQASMTAFLQFKNYFSEKSGDRIDF